MKKLILILLLVPSLVFAGSIQSAHKSVIARQGIAGGGGAAISDDFSSDTSADYTDIATDRGCEVTGGVAEMEGSNWSPTGRAYYSGTGADLGSANHYVQGQVNTGSVTSKAVGKLILRCDGNTTSSTGYLIFPDYGNSAQALMYKFTGTSDTYVNKFTYTGSNTFLNTAHLIRVSVNGSNEFELEVDWNDDGDFDDANESDMSLITDASHTGNYVGMGWYDNGEAAQIDDFEASPL